ncbi:MAG: hypothetical protein M3132_11145 [Actinomycetia bacterium]|nr:hypothetical protein [Actinomycetes bacterium]
MALAFGVVAAALVIAVDIFPIITNDSLAYIGHSNSLVTTGFIQIGYRQFGYPFFLASVDTMASLVHLEPLLATVLLQRLVYLSAVAFAVWLWRWRAIPLVVLAIVPSLLTYTNFILTEGIAIGLVAWYAVLVALVVRLGSSSSDGVPGYPRISLRAAGILASLVYVLLALIRFQYALLIIGVLGVWYVMYRAGGKVRTASIVTSVSVVLLLSLFFGAVTLENGRELGAFSPSARGERSRFWATWQVAFTLNPENRSNVVLAQFYGDGSPYTFMGSVDSLPSYADQQHAYAEAMEGVIDGMNTTWATQRLASAIGVLEGGRIDDVRSMVQAASQAQFDSIEESMFRARPIREEGIGYFIDRYNDGKRVQPLILSPLAPLRTFPYFVSILRWMLLSAIGVLLVGLFVRLSRLLAWIGILTLLSTVAVFGYLLMDNVRFILVPLLFVLFAATGVGDILWRQYRSRRIRPVRSAESSG